MYKHVLVAVDLSEESPILLMRNYLLFMLM